MYESIALDAKTRSTFLSELDGETARIASAMNLQIVTPVEGRYALAFELPDGTWLAVRSPRGLSEPAKNPTWEHAQLDHRGNGRFEGTGETLQGAITTIISEIPRYASPAQTDLPPMITPSTYSTPVPY